MQQAHLTALAALLLTLVVSACGEDSSRSKGGGEGETEGQEGEGEGSEGEGAEGEGAEGEGAEGEGAEGEGAEGEEEGFAQDQLALYKSGTRLKAIVGRTPDGSQAWLGWWDSELGIECIFMATSDGKERCLPANQYYIAYFSDENCYNLIVPFFLVNAQCKPPKYLGLSLPNENGCGISVGHVYISAEQFVGDVVYFLNPSGDCISMPSSTLTASGYHLYHAEPEVPLDRFVARERSILEP
ncbi:MAG: hypothetical protein RBU45_08735 [Myxococcota bacterium]|nr:hypothetical protein [Myxococcota bacterium]